MTVIAETSVILNLCCVGHGELLCALFHRVLIPDEVQHEFQRLSLCDARFSGLTLPESVEVAKVVSLPEALSAQQGLHAGEMAALALALEVKADAVLIATPMDAAPLVRWGCQSSGWWAYCCRPSELGWCRPLQRCWRGWNSRLDSGCTLC